MRNSTQKQPSNYSNQRNFGSFAHTNNESDYQQAQKQQEGLYPNWGLKNLMEDYAQSQAQTQASSNQRKTRRFSRKNPMSFGASKEGDGYQQAQAQQGNLGPNWGIESFMQIHAQTQAQQIAKDSASPTSSTSPTSEGSNGSSLQSAPNTSPFGHFYNKSPLTHDNSTPPSFPAITPYRQGPTQFRSNSNSSYNSRQQDFANFYLDQQNTNLLMGAKTGNNTSDLELQQGDQKPHHRDFFFQEFLNYINRPETFPTEVYRPDLGRGGSRNYSSKPQGRFSNKQSRISAPNSGSQRQKSPQNSFNPLENSKFPKGSSTSINKGNLERNL